MLASLSRRLRLTLLAGFLCLPSALQAYVISGYKWDDASSTYIYSSLIRADGTARAPSSNELWADIFTRAMDEWTGQTNFTFNRQFSATPDPCDYDGINGVAFAQDFCGDPFEDEVVALTLLSYFENPEGLHSFYDADIIFNDAISWDSYSGPVIFSAVDFYRVALHELGHGLGLGHEESAISVMASYISNEDSLTADDIAGAGVLYGSAADLCDESMALYFPHIASDGLWETEIGLVNTSASQSLTGQLLACDGSGNQLSDSVAVSLAAHQRLELTVGDVFPAADQIRYIALQSTATSLAGYTKFYIDGLYRVAVPAVLAADINSGNIYIPHIASDSQWWTGVSLLNTTTETKNLTITFDDGQSLAVSLSPLAHTAFTFDQYPGVGSALVSQAQGVIGLELFGSRQSQQRYLSGLLLADDVGSQMVIPHIASDSTWWTGLVVYSPFNTQLTITPYTQAGSALAAQSISVAPGDKYVGTAAALSLPDETAWLRLNSTASITGFELFGSHDGKLLAGYSALGIATQAGSFAKRERQGWTGLAFVNPNAVQNTVTLTAYNDSGGMIASEVFVLGPHEKRVNVLESLFTDSLIGATHVAFSATADVVGFQLNGSADGLLLDALPAL